MIKKSAIALFIIVFLILFLFVISLKPFAGSGKEEAVHVEVKDQTVKGDGFKAQVSSINHPVQKVSKSDQQKLEPEIQNELQKLLNTSSEGLREVVTEKGVMVDLEDRFRTAPVATINKKGEVLIQDHISPPKN